MCTNFNTDVMKQPIRVVLVDDHTIMREGLRKILTEDESKCFEVVGEFSNSQGFLEYLKYNACDVVLMDIQMPGRTGDSTLEICTKMFPHVSVVILSMITNEFMIERAIKNGAWGYLAKEANSQEIKASLIAANEKRVFYNHLVTPRKIHQFALGKKSSKLLSNQETIIIRYLAQGWSHDDIGKQLNISPSTVKKHKEHIMKKTNCTRSNQLFHYALEMGIIGGGHK